MGDEVAVLRTQRRTERSLDVEVELALFVLRCGQVEWEFVQRCRPLQLVAWLDAADTPTLVEQRLIVSDAQR
jgi:hypothetical protein